MPPSARSQEPALRHVVPLTAITAVAVALRAPWLGSAPNPAHDEGNWLLLAHRALRGEPAALSGDQAFVTALYARLIALSWRITGESVAGARAVQCAAVVLGVIAGYALLAKLRAPRAGLALAALLAVHPWSLAWSRVAVAPYALSLVTALLGTLAVAWAWSHASRSGVGRVAAAQLLALGFHFSPLAAIPAVACGLWVLLARRNSLRDNGTRVAVALAVAHVAPIALTAARVGHTGSTRPSGHLDHLAARIANYTGTLLDGLTGEATVRDFAGTELRGIGALVATLTALAVLGFALRVPRDERMRDLHALARLQLGVGVVGVALLLAPMRLWHLPSVDAERYAFAVLAPAMILVALLAEARAGALVAAACVAGLTLSPTARLAGYFHSGGGPDRGLLRVEGGGAQRRWKVTDDRVAVAEHILRAADALGRGQRVTVVVPEYVFHTLHFFNRARPHTVVDLSFAPVPLRQDARVLFVRWSDGVFAPGAPTDAPRRANAALSAAMHMPRFTDLRLVQVLRQPNGAALIELWSAVDHAPDA